MPLTNLLEPASGLQANTSSAHRPSDGLKEGENPPVAPLFLVVVVDNSELNVVATAQLRTAISCSKTACTFPLGGNASVRCPRQLRLTLGNADREVSV